MLFYGGVNSESTHIHDYDGNNFIGSDGIYKADQTPIKDKTSLENMGLAVFRDDKLVGELNGLETICHLIVTNNLERCSINIPDPNNENKEIYLTLEFEDKTKTDVTLINGTPYININIDLTGNILTTSNELDYSSNENLEQIEQVLNSYLTQQIYSFLYKTSKEFNSDICGFGRNVVGNYLTVHEWLQSDWLNNYKNSFFNVNVESYVKSGYLYIKN